MVTGTDATAPTTKKARRTYSRHGLSPLKARIRVRGLSVIDRRSAAARGLLEHRRELIEDLGGDTSISAQQRGVVEMVARTRLLIDHGAAFLLEQKSLVNRRRKAFIPLVRELQTLVDSYARLLGQLGLERKARPAKTLNEVMEEIAREREARQAALGADPPSVPSDGNETAATAPSGDEVTT